MFSILLPNATYSFSLFVSFQRNNRKTLQEQNKKKFTRFALKQTNLILNTKMEMVTSVEIVNLSYIFVVQEPHKIFKPQATTKTIIEYKINSSLR